MSFARRLIHRLAIVEPDDGDPEDEADLDTYGDAIQATPSVTLVSGLVQPRSGKEVLAVSEGGAELSTHIVFLLPRRIGGGAWIRDADESGILTGGRRFDIVNVRSFEFGRSPHLEVDVRLVGSTEGAAVGS